MFNESRGNIRLPIPKYYTGGSFHLIDGEREYHYIRANDVCVSGVGLDVPSSLDRGKTVKLRFAMEGWRADLDGIVMWCARADRVGVSMRSYENYRVGIRLDPTHAQDNAMLFLTLKDSLEEQRPGPRV